MGLSWIKIGSRVAVIIIIYLLLSIPDTKYQYFSEEVASNVPTFKIGENLITGEAKFVLSSAKEEQSIQYDSLIDLIATELTFLKSEIIDSHNSMIQRMTENLGRASVLAGLSAVDTRPILEHLWQWRQYLKEQSLFWNINDDKVKLQMATAINFVGLCEDFIITNRDLNYSKTTGSLAALDAMPIQENIKSGDILLSSHDISYSFLEQAKIVPQLTVSLGLILINVDSSFYISSTPGEGLQIKSYAEFNARPFAKRLHLRLRNDLPELISNPAMPHQAATFLFGLANDVNIDYDFRFNRVGHSSLSEIELLEFSFEGYNLDFITSFSEVNNAYVYGLSRLGIENGIQATASEILFHPAIELVGQQLTGRNIKSRNLQMAANMAGLSAITAELITSLRWKLPYYRVLKGYSRIAGLMGNAPIMPDGMAPETALIVNYISDQSEELMPGLVSEANQFEQENKFYPTYTILSEMATSLLVAQGNK
jgi:hypothetical protein